MLDFIKETTSIWDVLRNSTLPIVIYGMGDGAEKIMNVCDEYNIKISDIFASDKYVRGHSFCGYKVLKLSELEQKYEDFIILLAFAAHTEMLISDILKISQTHPLYAPDVPVSGGGLFTFDYLMEHQKEFSQVYNMLADQHSQKVYSDILNYKISGKIQYLLSHTTEPENDMIQLLKLTNKEHYVDLGAYDGDTIFQLMRLCNGYQSIVALEPDIKNFRKLIKNIEKENLLNISCYNIGSYSHQSTLNFDNSGSRNSSLSKTGTISIDVNAVDNIISLEKPVTYIKMDVEGAEYETLIGCKEVILLHKPALNIAAYHRNDDLYRLPLYLKSLNPNYKIYLRHHRYIPAWETIIYAK